VTTTAEHYPPWDGTVVDVVEDPVKVSPLYRVYWRYPFGKVADYRQNELRLTRFRRPAF